MKLVVVLLAIALFEASSISAVSLGKIYGLPFECPSKGDFPIPGMQCTPFYYNCKDVDGKLTEFTSACYLSDQISLTFIFDPEALKCIDFKESSCYGVPLHNEVN